MHIAGAAWVALDVGVTATGACRVAVLNADDGSPEQRRTVRYRVLTGPVRIGRARKAAVRTDRDGYASVDLRAAEAGASIVAAELAADRSQTVYFRVATEGRVHRLVISAPPTVDARGGRVNARLFARDQHDAPVTGATLSFEAGRGKDSGVVGSVRDLGGGEYAAKIRLREAGEWRLSAVDDETKVLAGRSIHVLPGPPDRIALVGETDPRASEPYDQILLRARLEDAQGNALDPHLLRCSVAGRRVDPTAVTEDEARFLVVRDGSGSVAVRLSGAKVSRSLKPDFAAVWLADPGVVRVGAEMRLPVYLDPPAGKPVHRATIDLSLDRRRTRLVAFEPSGEVRATVEDKSDGGARVVVEPGARRRRIPERVPVGSFLVRCTGEGRSCMRVAAAMSPSKPGWELCVDQKRDQQKCICINLIYRAGDAAGLAQGRAAVAVVAGILGSLRNVQRCCPDVRVERRECEISAADWTARVVPAIGTAADGTPAATSVTDSQRLIDAGLCQRTRCINFMMLRLAWPDGRIGSTRTPAGMGGLARGFGIIDPAGVARDPNVAAHEAGHALGLDHGGPPANLMHPTAMPSGLELTAAECRTIWRNVDRFAC